MNKYTGKNYNIHNDKSTDGAIILDAVNLVEVIPQGIGLCNSFFQWKFSYVSTVIFFHNEINKSQ